MYQNPKKNATVRQATLRDVISFINFILYNMSNTISNLSRKTDKEGNVHLFTFRSCII